MPRGGLGRDHVLAPPLQIPQVGEPFNVASGPADVRDGEIERLGSRPVKARDAEVSVQDDDRNIDRVQDRSVVKRCAVRFLCIAWCPLELGPAATCGIRFHRYRFAVSALYNLPQRCNTESETVGRTWRNASSNACARGMLNFAGYRESSSP